MSSDLKAAYLLTGSDRPKIERALRRLRERFGEDSVERLSAREASGEDVVAACNALGLFATSGRLVLVDEVELWKAADAKTVADYLAAPAPDTILALVGEEIKKDSPLAKASAKAGDVLVYEVSKRDLPRWVGEQFARHGVKASAEACRAVVELVGDNPQELTTEVDKLAVFAGHDPIGVDEVELLVAARADVPPYVLMDAWGSRDVAGVLSAAEAILERGRSGQEHVLVAAAASHVRKALRAKRFDEEGRRARDVMGELNVRFPFLADKLFGQSRNFSADELREAIVRLADLDLALKGGSRLPAELELQRTLVAITRASGEAAAAQRRE